MKSLSISSKKDYNKSELSQFKKIYQSTIEFSKFLHHQFINSRKVLDVGTGIGGTLSFYTNKYKDIDFIGSDYRAKYVNQSKYIFNKLKINQNVTFQKIDILKKITNKNLDKIDGIISEKTFCTFKDISKPLNNLIKLKPKWIGINSLFFDGYMDVIIHQRQLSPTTFNSLNNDNDPDGDFNIHSLKKLKKLVKTYGYKVSKCKKFYPKKKLKSNRLKFGTYTIKTEMNKNTCFTGPVHLPWYFVLIEKKN